MRAAYDSIADWYEEYITGSEYTDRVTGLVERLLGRGTGPLLDLGCGTGYHAATLRRLGWIPLGVDLSLGQLRHASVRLPVVAADATRLPVASASVDAVACLLVHTDLPDYPAVVREAARVLRPGGTYLHVGIHPCFCGAFADRSDGGRIVVDASYDRRERRFDSFTPHGVRVRVGAWHTPLDALLQGVADAGLRLARVEEAGAAGAVPDVLAFTAVRASR